MYRFITSNVRKTYLFLAVIFALIILIGYFLSWYFSDFSLLIGALFFALFYNLLAYYYSDRIVLSISGARPISKKHNLELFRLVENLCIRTGLPLPKIYVINDNSPNAFATGRDPYHASVAVTSGLLNIMDKRELEGVLAHEISHIKNYDIRLQTIVAILVGAIIILTDYLRRIFWFSSGDRRERGILGLIILLIVVILAPLVARLIQLAISRKREFLADASSAEITRFPQGLASALRKIAGYSQGIKRVTLATVHLYFASPFGSKEKKTDFLVNLFSTHPPVEERISILEKMGF